MNDEIEYRFTDMRDAETVPIEDLKREVARLQGLSVFYDTKQLAIKKFINSVYGALGSKYFIAYNTAMAESITAQGRELNHYSENSVNDYFEGIFQSNPKIVLYYHWVHYDGNGDRATFKDKEKYPDFYKSGKWEECKAWDASVKNGKKLTPELKNCLQDNSEGQCDWFQTQTTLFQKLQVDPELASNFDIDKGRTTPMPKLTGKDFEYLTNPQNVSMVCGGDTDSCTYDTMLRISADGIKQRVAIGDFFTDMKLENNDVVLNVPNGSEVVPVSQNSINVTVKSYDPDLDMAVYKPVRYVMRHKVKKARYRITTDDGKSVTVTGDHSVMVVRDNTLMSVPAKDINIETDKIITIEQ